MKDFASLDAQEFSLSIHPVRRAVISMMVAMVLACAAIVAPQAKAAVYWGDNGLVGAVNLDGSGADFGYFNPANASGIINSANCDVAVNSRYLYWLGSLVSPVDKLQISRVNLDGPTVAEPIVSGLSVVCNLAASESYLYWTNAEAQTITRANLDGTEANAAFIGGVAGPCGLAVDEHHVYWASEQGIGRANLEGGEIEPSFIPGFRLCSVAVTDHYIFWSDHSTTISRANIDGSEVNDHFISGAGRVGSIAADAAHLYWANWYEGGQTLSTIGHASLDGTDVNQSWVTTNRRDPLSGIAVDSRLSLSPLPLPSRLIRLGKVRHSRRTGVVVIDVWAWDGGELAVISPKINWRVRKTDSPFPADGPVRWRLKLWPGKLGDVARHIHTQLKRKGRAPISLRVFYREAGKTPIVKRKRLAFVRRRGR